MCVQPFEVNACRSAQVGVNLKIKENVDIVSFLDKTKECLGDVFLHTAEGDILNLKSLLSQYILMSILCNPVLLENARVICTDESDYLSLSDYLREDAEEV